MISGPSGSGKGTAMGHMTRLFPGIQKAATFTTRAPRPGERPGIDYHFITPEAFQAKVESGEIYEFTRTYGDYVYGSPRRLLETDEFAPLLVELEVKGMLRLKAATRRRLVSVFVLVGVDLHALDRLQSIFWSTILVVRLEIIVLVILLLI